MIPISLVHFLQPYGHLRPTVHQKVSNGYPFLWHQVPSGSSRFPKILTKFLGAFRLTGFHLSFIIRFLKNHDSISTKHYYEMGYFGEVSVIMYGGAAPLPISNITTSRSIMNFSFFGKCLNFWRSIQAHFI